MIKRVKLLYENGNELFTKKKISEVEDAIEFIIERRTEYLILIEKIKIDKEGKITLSQLTDSNFKSFITKKLNSVIKDKYDEYNKNFENLTKDDLLKLFNTYSKMWLW